MSPTRSSGHRRRSASTAFPRASRRVSSTACSALLVAVLAAGGCGGAEPERAALPADVGAALAQAADDVGAALEAGDPAGAQAEADELLAAVEEAIARGDVPPELAGEARSGAERLAALVAGVQPPPPPPPPAPPEEEDDEEDDEDDDENRGRGNGEDRGKGNGNDDDEDDD